MRLRLALLLAAVALHAETAEDRYRAVEQRAFDAKLESNEDLKPPEVRRAEATHSELARLRDEQMPRDAAFDRDLLLWHLERRLAFYRRFHAPRANAHARGDARGPPHDEWDRYAMRLQYDFGVDYGPDELLSKAFAFWDAALGELKGTCREIDPDLPWREVMDRLKDDHPAADALLPTAQRQLERAIRFVERHRLVTIPDSAKKVEAKWGDPKAKTPFGHYLPPDQQAGSVSEQGQGWYVVIPVDGDLTDEEKEARLRANNIHWTRCVALHEAIPGHHLQFAIANARASRVRKIFYNSAFVEGWGLYCEGMMARAGYFGDPRDRASQQKMRLWRAARVIIDVGTHLGRMTQEEGVELLVDGVGMERACARDEVQRYVDAPLYYSGYMAGCLELEALRRECEKRDGASFDLCAFHDAVLACGPLPFRFVRRAVLSSPH